MIIDAWHEALDETGFRRVFLVVLVSLQTVVAPIAVVLAVLEVAGLL